MTIVTVRLPGITRSEFPLDIASRGMAQADVAIQIASPNPLPALDTSQEMEAAEDANAAITVGDPAMQSLLFGRYTGQINARIQRAWRKPRSPIGAVEGPSADANGATAEDRFRCQARILQDERGNVREIELVDCNGSPQWQQSLISAIQTSSPLPSPPSRSVFSDKLTLAFEGRAYTDGMSDQGYEPTIQVDSRELSGAARNLSPQLGVSLRDYFGAATDSELPADAPTSPPVELAE